MIVILIALLIYALTIFLCRRYVLNTFNTIDKILDSVLLKNQDIKLDKIGENRSSKLAHKAIKIMEMTQAEISQTLVEKESVQSFVSDMSHQVKTPLASISMYTDLILEGGLTKEELEEFLLRIKAGAEKLKWLMTNLVKMSRLEVGTIQIQAVPTSIKQTISESINAVSSALQKEISISVSDFEDLLLLHDKKWTSEAIVNILENAVKYSSVGSKIKIEVEQLSIYSKINIEDNGVGIEASEWNQVFNRFYRGKNVSNKEGVGLGLYLSRLILEKQGGYIMLDSKVGEYSKFSIFLQNCKK